MLRALPTLRADQRRPLQYLSGKEVRKWTELWHVTDFPTEPTTSATQTDYAEMDTGAFEILWRVVPPKTVYISPYLDGFIGRTQEKEVAEMRAEALNLLAREELAVVPLWNMGPSHWTL